MSRPWVLPLLCGYVPPTARTSFICERIFRDTAAAAAAAAEEEAAAAVAQRPIEQQMHEQ